MAGKRNRQAGKYSYVDGAVGDVDSVRDSTYGWTVTLIGHDLEYEVTTVETDNGPEITHLWIREARTGRLRPMTSGESRCDGWPSLPRGGSTTSTR